MTKEQFDSLAIGDKVCNAYMPQAWGYIEDIDRTNGMVEFDVEEAFINLGMMVSKGVEIKSSFVHLDILEKATTANVVLSQNAKDAINLAYKAITDAQNAILGFKNILKI